MVVLSVQGSGGHKCPRPWWYNTTKKMGRPRSLPDNIDELTPEQRRKRLWNEQNKEHLSKYNKQRREQRDS